MRNSFAAEDGDIPALVQFDNFIFLTPTQLQTLFLAEQVNRILSWMGKIFP